MPFTYREVKDLYDSLPRQESLPDFSTRMNQLTESDLYSAGLDDNIVKRASVGLDRLLEATGLPDVLGDVGETFGDVVFNNPEEGRRQGQKLLRGAVNFAPSFIPILGPAARFLGTAGLSGSEAYTESGSTASGVVTGAISGAMPWISKGIENQILKRMFGVSPIQGRIATKRGTDFVREYLPQNLRQGFTAFAGGEVGASIADELGSMISAGVDPNLDYHFDPSAAAINMTLGQLPFGVISAVSSGARSGFGGKSTRKHEQKLREAIAVTRINEALAQAKRDREMANPLETLPDVEVPENPTELAKSQHLLTQLFQKVQQAKQDPDSISMEDAEKAEDQIANIMQSVRAAGYKGNGVMGISHTERTNHQPMVGKLVYTNKSGTWRIIELEDGRRIGHSYISSTPQPKDIGRGEWKQWFIPDGFYKEVKNDLTKDPALRKQQPRTRAQATNLDPRLNPELEPSPMEADISEWMDLTRELQEAEGMLNDGTKKSIADFHGIIQKINLVRGLMDLPELNDAQIAKRGRILGIHKLEKILQSEVNAAKRAAQKRQDDLTKFIAEDEGVPDAPLSGGKQDGRAMLDLSKADEPTQVAILDVIDEWMADVAGFDAKFEEWNKTNKTDKTIAEHEKLRFGHLVKLMTLGDIDYKPEMTKAELGAFVEQLAEDGLRPGNPDALKDFMARPHVELLLKELNARLEQSKGKLKAPDVGFKWIKAGDGFVWNLQGYNPILKKLGNRNVDKPIAVAAFKNLAGAGQPIADIELEMMQQLVPEAFDEKGNVDVVKLADSLAERAPVLEVRKLGEEGLVENEKTRRYAQLIHELDTELGTTEWREIEQGSALYNKMPPSTRAKFDEWITMAKDDELMQALSAGQNTSKYRFVSPKPESEMSGYVEGLVRVPLNKTEDVDNKGRPTGRFDTTSPLYSGPHFGSEDINVLAFFRGYEEKLPDGRKAFHVIEVQSDWGQNQRTMKEELKNAEPTGKVKRSDDDTHWRVELRNGDWISSWKKTESEALADITEGIAESNKVKLQQSHPLLPLYETLALKAAISHARSIGADSVILSDAETAMMTEGHDRAGANIRLLRPEEVKNLQIAKAAGPTTYGTWVQNPAESDITHRLRDVKVDPKGVIPTNDTFVRVRNANGRFDYVNISNPDWNPGHNEKIIAKELATEFPNGEGLSFTDEAPRVSQSGGMRLHYDQTLPSAMKKLTGEEGQRVEMGTHKNAERQPIQSMWETETSDLAEPGPVTYTVRNRQTGEERTFSSGEAADEFIFSRTSGSPVFRNPDGTPKSSISGRLYSIKSLPAFERQEGFTLGSRNKAPRISPFVPNISEDVELAAALRPEAGAVGALDWVLKNSQNPIHQALAKDLLEMYPDVMARTAVKFIKGDTSQISNVREGNRTAEIWLGDEFWGDLPQDREFTVLHEALHAISVTELENPAKAATVGKINNLMEDVIKTMPKAWQDVLNKAKTSEFLKKYQMGQTDFGALHEDNTTARLLYAMLDNKEFIAQGMSDSVVRDYLLKQGGRKKTGLFTKFKNFLKELVGIKDGTMLDELVEYTSELTSDINTAFKFHDFAERMLSRKGLSGDELDIKSRLSQAVLSNMESYGNHPPDLVDLLLQYDGKLGRDQGRAKNELDTSILNEDENFQHLEKAMASVGKTATRQDVNDLTKDILSGDADPTMLEILPAPAARYIFEQVSAIRDILDVIKGATTPELKGFINIKNLHVNHARVKQLIKKFDTFLDSERMHDEAVAALQSLMQAEPKNFFQQFLKAPELVERNPLARSVFAPRIQQGKEVEGWFGRFMQKVDRFFRPVGQYDDPVASEVFSKGWQLSTNIRNMFKEVNSVYGIDFLNMEATTESLERAIKGLKNPKVLKALDKWIYWNQKNGKDTGKTTILPKSDARIQQVLSKLNPEEVAVVEDFIQKHQLANQRMSAQVLEKLDQMAVVTGARLLGTYNNGKVSDNVKIAEVLYRAMQVDPNDPASVAKAQGEIAQVQAKTTPEAFNAAFEFLQNKLQERGIYKQHFDDNPAWSSGQRFGKYRARWQVGKKVYVAGVNSMDEAKQLAKGATITEFVENQKPNEEPNPYIGTDKQEVIDRLMALEKGAYEMMSKAGFDQEALDMYKRLSVASQFARETAGQTGANIEGAPPRGLTRGAEELPWFSNHFSWMGMTASKWSRALFRAQMDAYLGQSDIAANDQLQGNLRTHRDNLLQADPESIQNLNTFTRTWFMGLNMANVMVNGFQPIVTHVAELTNQTGSMLGSYKRVMRALREVAGRKWRNKEWATEEHEKFMKDAVHDGEVGISQFDEHREYQESAAANFKRAADFNRPKTLGQRMSTLLGHFSHVGMFMFRHGEMVNNQAALLASFDLYREQGKSYEEAKQLAYDFNHKVNFAGGREQRAIGMFSGRSPVLRGAAMLANSMQSYVLGTTFQLIRYLKRGLFSGSKLTPGEKWAARKAFGQMLGTQFALAGALGLPFASAALGLVDKLLPELEVNKNLRELIAQLMNEDEEDGNVLTDMAMTGVPSMLGWDMQSRLSMGNTLPGVSEINGFQPQALLGPPANLIGQFLKGGHKLVTGQGKVSDWMPSFAKKLVNVAEDDWKLKDFKNRPFVNPEPTPGEKAGLFLGFNPKRASDLNAAARIADLSERNRSSRLGEQRVELAEQLLAGQIGSVRQRLTEQAAGDKTFDVVAEARAVARAAEALTFPRDLRREGREPTRSKLLSSFKLDLSRPDEQLRFDFRRRLEQALGVPQQAGTLNRELMLAQLMDQMKQQFPDLPRRELRRLAERQLRRETSSSLLE